MKGDAAATTPTDYIAGLEEPRRSDVAALHDLIRETTPDLEPVMIHGMIGYGPYHYKYASGREGDTARICLASQKNYISLYVICGDGNAEKYAGRLPKASIGKSCVRFKRLSDLDPDVLKEMFLEASTSSVA